MNEKDLKFIFFDKCGNIYYNIEYDFKDLDFINELYGEYKDLAFICLLDRKFYNELTKCGRKKEFNIIERKMIDFYVNCEYYNSFWYRFKRKIRESCYIFYNAVIRNKKVLFLVDVDKAQKDGIRYGLDYLRQYKKGLSSIKNI